MSDILWLDTVDSTSSVIQRQIRSLDNLSAIAAYAQTAGRGQRGNRWLSRPGENLTFSLLLKFGVSPLAPLPSGNFNRLNLLASISVRDFLLEEGCEAAVKWPNDLYAGGRKICGILIENSLGPSGIAHSVIGIGINLNQRSFDELANATSLVLETGRTTDLPAALERFMQHFKHWLPALSDESVYTQLRGEYDAALFRKGIPAKYRNILEDKEFTGILKGVEEDGKAVVRDCGDGSIYRFAFKELGYIL